MRYLLLTMLIASCADTQPPSATPHATDAERAWVDDVMPVMEASCIGCHSVQSVDGIATFYGAVREPCRRVGAVCPAVEVVPGFWSFRYVENPGAAWGLFSTAHESLRIPFFFLVSVAAIGFILWYVKKLENGQRLLLFSLSLVCGGAIGNFIDRVRLGHVIDFVDAGLGTIRFYTFNVADMAVSASVLLLIALSLRSSLAGDGAGDAGDGR